MKSLFTKNLGWKAGSLALSALLWFGLEVDPTAATTATVAVQYRNLPVDLDLASLAVEKVQIEVQGSSTNLSSNNLADINAVLDMKRVTGPGEQTFNVGDDIRLPVGVRLIRATPSQIRLKFEKHMEREVPIVLRFSGPPDGFEVVSHWMEPKTFTVQGPASSVDKVTSVETDKVELRAGLGEQVVLVRAFVNDPRLRFSGDNHVTAHIKLRPVVKE